MRTKSASKMTATEAKAIVAEMAEHDLRSEGVGEGGPIRCRNGDINGLATIRGWDEAVTNAGDVRTALALLKLGERKAAELYEKATESKGRRR